VYYGMVEELDAQVGEVLKALEECNAHKNTLVIFTADHGEMLGAHGKLGKVRIVSYLLLYEDSC